MKENLVYTLSDNKNYYISKAIKVDNKSYYIASKIEDENGEVVFLSEDNGEVTFVEDFKIITKITKALATEIKKSKKQKKNAQ